MAPKLQRPFWLDRAVKKPLPLPVDLVSVRINGKAYEIDLLDPNGVALYEALLDFASQMTALTPSRTRAESVGAVAARVGELLEYRDDLLGDDPSALAERMVASIPTRHEYDAVAGPFYDTAGLRKWLGISRQALAARVAAGSLLACPTQEGQLVYPAWQFQPDGTTVAHLAEVIKILRPAAATPWTVATWLRTPGGENVEGADAVTWLSNGGDVTPILAEAREDAARWAS